MSSEERNYYGPKHRNAGGGGGYSSIGSFTLASQWEESTSGLGDSPVGIKCSDASMFSMENDVFININLVSLSFTFS